METGTCTMEPDCQFMANCMRSVILSTGSGGTSGLYRCDIETIAVNNNDGHETVYVGLYNSGGEWP